MVLSPNAEADLVEADLVEADLKVRLY